MNSDEKPSLNESLAKAVDEVIAEAVDRGVIEVKGEGSADALDEASDRAFTQNLKEVLAEGVEQALANTISEVVDFLGRAGGSLPTQELEQNMRAKEVSSEDLSALQRYIFCDPVLTVREFFLAGSDTCMRQTQEMMPEARGLIQSVANILKKSDRPITDEDIRGQLDIKSELTRLPEIIQTMAGMGAVVADRRYCLTAAGRELYKMMQPGGMA